MRVPIFKQTRQYAVDLKPPLMAAVEVRKLLQDAYIATGVGASHALVVRTRLEVRRQITRRSTRRSLLRRALAPVFFYVAVMYLVLIESAVDPSFDEGVMKIILLSCYLLAIFLPWLVVQEERRRAFSGSS